MKYILILLLSFIVSPVFASSEPTWLQCDISSRYVYGEKRGLTENFTTYLKIDNNVIYDMQGQSFTTKTEDNLLMGIQKKYQNNFLFITDVKINRNSGGIIFDTSIGSSKKLYTKSEGQGSCFVIKNPPKPLF